jgi:SpoVK/Ycf46/Vps4 family AAA+-type ATPase
MDNLNFNNILNRENEYNQIKQLLTTFEANKNDPLVKKGIYIYGSPGCGKTTFVMQLLKEMNYDVIKYDAGDVRNKLVIDTITKHNMSDKNIMSMFNKKIKKIVIVMDEIDGMNSGDKGGINTLIKLIRPKKTKKQKQEEMTMSPIICISNYHVDKKIKELMKVCNPIELNTPNTTQINTIINQVMPDIDPKIIAHINEFIQGDLRKLHTIYNIYKNKQHVLTTEIIQNIFQMKSYNDDTKQITKNLINNPYPIQAHGTLMNETDRTIVGLLWHENIADVLTKLKPNVYIPLYLKLLQNICFADYIDRITFQKQIWQFNEMSSIIKTFHNNKIYHESFLNAPAAASKKKTKHILNETRFTKVLTKYSTEYNNSTFIQVLCHQLAMDKKDLFSFFLNLRNNLDDANTELVEMFDNCDITKLDINRIYRYLDKYIKEDAVGIEYVETESIDEMMS